MGRPKTVFNCLDCAALLSGENTTPTMRRNYANRCVECYRSYRRRYYHKDAGLYRRYRQRIREKLFEVFLPVCSLCGVTEPDVLQFDHKAPLKRSEERRQSGMASGRANLWRALLEGLENPFNLQVLCANCHVKKTNQDLQYGSPRRRLYPA